MLAVYVDVRAFGSIFGLSVKLTDCWWSQGLVDFSLLRFFV